MFYSNSKRGGENQKILEGGCAKKRQTSVYDTSEGDHKVAKGD